MSFIRPPLNEPDQVYVPDQVDETGSAIAFSPGAQPDMANRTPLAYDATRPYSQVESLSPRFYGHPYPDTAEPGC